MQDHALDVTYHHWDADTNVRQAVTSSSGLRGCLAKAYSEACAELTEAQASWVALDGTPEGRREKVGGDNSARALRHVCRSVVWSAQLAHECCMGG